MANPQIDRLMDNARIHLPSAIDPAIQREVFNTLDEFLRISLVWKEDIDVDVTTDSQEYDVIPSSGQAVQLIELVNGDGIPVAGTMEEPEVLILSTLPSEETTLTATLGLTVVDPVRTNGDPDLPDWILVKYFLGVLDGVIGRMMAQPAKPYSNERLSIYHLRRFRDAIAQARVDARRANLYGAQRWRFPSFA